MGPELGIAFPLGDGPLLTNYEAYFAGQQLMVSNQANYLLQGGFFLRALEPLLQIAADVDEEHRQERAVALEAAVGVQIESGSCPDEPPLPGGCRRA
jgi:hypothetical protein